MSWILSNLVGPDKIQEDDEDENGVSARTISELFCLRSGNWPASNWFL